MKSDVKGYYAHIDHHILLDQLNTLLPKETRLQGLLSRFLQRSVERGGNYRDITCGIPLGSSLSPLLGALYLSPLDALYRQDNKHFYRRYMDDWVIFCKNRWDLRDTVKKVYAVLYALKVEVAPDKTYLGKAQKGFDFLGKRIHPTGILPSASALSPLHTKTVRLYEQGASTQRIGKYWVRWLGWAFGAVAINSLATPVNDVGGDEGTPSATCFVAAGSSVGARTFTFGCTSQYVTEDSAVQGVDSPIWIVLPDQAPSGGTFGAAAYSYAEGFGEFSLSVAPTVSCAGGVVAERTFSTTIGLESGASCTLTVTPKDNGDADSDVVYTGTLTRTGDVYFLTAGCVSGGPYTACAPTAPVSAPISSSMTTRLFGFGLSLCLFWGLRRRYHLL